MPHKSPFRKDELDSGFEAAGTGDLTYILFREAIAYLTDNGARPAEDADFEELASVVAAFECAKLEFVRLYLVPFEKKAIERNGEACRP